MAATFHAIIASASRGGTTRTHRRRPRRRGSIRAAIVVALALVSSVMTAAPSYAVDFVFNVDDTADVPDFNPGDGICATGPSASPCTLRAAVDETNAAGTGDTVTINVPAGTYNLTAGSLHFSTPGPDSVIVQGPIANPPTASISAGGLSQLFSSDGAGLDITLSHLEISDGFVAGQGGCISGNSDMTLIQLDIHDCQAAFGGAVLVTFGDMTIVGGSIHDNTANQGAGISGGGGGGVLTVTGTTIGPNNAAASEGGGVFYTNGDAHLTNATVIGNTALDGGGLAALNGTTLELDNVSVDANVADRNGGGIFVLDSTLDASAGTIANNFADAHPSDVTDQGGVGGGIHATGSATVVNISNGLSLADNESEGGGGGMSVGDISFYNILNSSITGNITEGTGGGLKLTDAGLTSNTNISLNDAIGGGGGVAFEHGNLDTSIFVDNEVVDNTSLAGGGGVLVASSSVVSIVRSAIVDNGVVSGGEGGGGIKANPGTTLTTVSSTIARNGAAQGGGIEVNGTTVTAYYTTITDNDASGLAGGGGAYFRFGGQLDMRASILSGNDVFSAPAGTENCNTLDPGAQLLVNGFNLFDIGPCGFVNGPSPYTGGSGSDVQTTDPQLTITGNGIGATYSPDPTSPAMEIVNLTACDEIKTDLLNLPNGFGTVDQSQDAIPRPQGPGCEAGAIEIENFGGPPSLSIDATAAGTFKPGASVVNLGSIPVKSTSIEGSDGDATKAVSLSSIPLSAIPLSAVDLTGTPLSAVPLSAVPLSAVPLSAVPLSAVPLSAVPLSAVPLSAVHLPQGWDSLIALHPRLAGRPLHTISFLDIVQELQAPDTPTIAPGFVQAFESIQLGDMDLAASPLSAVPLSAVMMAPLEMLDVPLPTYPDGTPVNASDPQDVFNAWCAWFAHAGGPTCADLGLDTTADAEGVNMLTLGLAAAPLSAVPLSAVPLSAIPLSAIPLSAIPLSAVDMSVSPLSAIPLSAVYLDDPVAAPLSAIPLSAVDLENSPLSAVPLSAVPLSAVPLSAVPLSAVPLSAVPLSAVSATGAPLSAVPLSAVPLSAVPLSAVPLSAVPLSAIEAELGSAQFAALFTNCPAGGCDPNATFKFAVDQGWIPGNTPMSELLPLWRDGEYGDIANELSQSVQDQVEAFHADPDTQLEDILAWGSFTLGWLWQFADQGSDLLAAFVTTLLGQLVAGGAAAYGDSLVGDLPAGQNGATIGDLLTSVNWEFAGTPALTYIDLFFGLLPKEKFPWADLDLSQFDVASADPNGQTFDLEVEITLADAGPSNAATVTVALPDTFQPGSNLPTSSNAATIELVEVNGFTATYEVADLPSGVTTLSLPISAGLRLGGGAIDVTVDVPAHSLTDSDSTSPIQVIEEFETNDTPADITGHAPFDEDTIVLSHIGREGDVDLFKLDVDAGDRISIALGNFDVNLDLVLYAPRNGPPLSSGQPAFVTTSNSGEKADDESTGDVPRLADRPLYELSAARGLEPERIDTAAVPSGGEYLIQVTGYDSAVSDQPYTLRARVLDAPPPVECAPWPFVDPNVGPAAATPVSGSPTTLLLVNEQRTRQFEGTAGWATIDAALDNFLANTGQGQLGHVDPAVVEVSAFPSVQAAYAAWDANRCSVDAANAVVESIRSEVTALRDQFPSITSVAVIGPDRVIPSGRLVDDVPKEAPGIANERGHWTTFGDTNDELVAALKAGRYLSDDPYVDSEADLAGALPLFIPEIAIGRLVETPAEIASALDRFVQFNGLLDVSSGYTADVTGYDFLTDGAHAVADALDEAGGGTTDRSLISPDWTDDDLAAALATNPSVLSLNAHFDHHRLLPADQDKAGTEIEERLFTQDEFDALGPDIQRSILFSMGCHAGLSVTDVSLSVTESRDWAQVFSGAGAVFAGSSGFGYGDTDLVAYTELLMAEFAEGLDGSTDVGTAMSFAKNRFFAGLTQPGPVNVKVGSQVIFYGLPMYELNIVGPVLDNPLELVPGPSPIDDVLARDVAYDGTQGSGLLERVDSTDQDGTTESYWKVGPQDGTEVQQGRPIQPKWTTEVTAGDGSGGLAAVARGAVVETLTTTELGGINPVISTPVMAEGSEVAETDPTGIAFPDAFARVATLATPTGQVQQLDLIPGQFRSDVGETNGTQRLFEEAGLTVYYVDEGDPAVPQAIKDDHLPPAIVGVTGTTANGLVTFEVASRDPETNTARVLVLMSNASAATRNWQPVELAPAGTRASDGAALFTTTVASPWAEVEFIVQAVDDAGNVAVSTNRGDFHPAVAGVSNPDPGDGAPSLAIVAGTLHASGFYTSDVTVEVSPADPADTVLVSIDGQSPTTDPGPFVVTGSGPHDVEAWKLGDEANKATLSFGIDVDAPEIILNGGFSDSAIVSRDTILDLPAVSVTDAGSGLADGSPSITGGSTSVTGLQAFTVSATDRVGLSSAASRSYRVVDIVHEEAIHVGQTLTVDVLGVEAGAMVDFGDGFVTAANTPVTVNGEPGYRASHAYSAVGTYQISATVDDVEIDGGLVQVFAAFDTKDSVKGQGTLIGSLLGILHGAPTPVLPTVGINVKYTNGLPTGTMSVNDALAGFSFSSTKVTTIAVQNKVAQVQGVGTLPGVNGNVHWHVTIVDGGFLLFDKLRVRVWKGTQVFYDTHPGALLTTPMGAPVLLGGYTLTSSD